ncbi:MAG: TonB-dependent receptor [Acetobacteraceae bacterium]|nr:TonB-dependent receptor [Acetobacteraceae bacterium]
MRFTLALLATTFCVPALAAEPDATAPGTMLPDVVVTATRVPTPVEDIPAGVSIIDRKTIETNDYETLSQALSAIPGVHVSPAGGPGGQASVFIRGTDSNHVLVLRDGMPLNDASDSSGAFNFGVDTLADVERIEVIRGPMAALYGSGAIGGVINLISRRGTEQGVHITGDLAGGYPAAIRGSVLASGVEGPIDFALSAESQSQRGADSVPQRMSIYTGTPEGFRDRVATLNLGYTPVDGTRLSLFLRARQSLFGFNELGYPTYDTANSSGEADSLMGRVGVTSKLFNGSYETGLFVGRLQDDRHYNEPLDPNDPNQAQVDDRYHTYRTDVQWNNTVHLNDFFQSSVLSASALTFGYEHIDDTAKIRVSNAYFGVPFAEGANASMTTDAAYTGLQTTLWQRLTLTGQLRQDWVGPNAPTTWRIGAVYDASELDTHFKLAYGTAFRAPSLFDRFGVDSYGYVGNPNLKPERAQGWEAGFTTALPARGIPDFVSFGATYFNQQIEDLITTVFTPIDTAINIGSAHIQGVETEVMLRPVRWATLRASWTFTDAVNADTNSALLRRPQNAATLNATITPLPGLSIAPELIYTGAFQDYLYDNNSYGIGYGATQHGLIANLTVTYDVTPRVQLYANGRNLFDSHFEPVNGYQTPGPTALAGVRIRL